MDPEEFRYPRFYAEGVSALWLLFNGIVSAIFFELAASAIFRRSVRVQNGNGILIGLILDVSLSINSPWWFLCIGNFVAIFIGKELWGGLGFIF